MQNPYANLRLPVFLAKRLVERRGGEATRASFASNFLDIRIGGRYMHSLRIVDDCVQYLDLTAAFAERKTIALPVAGSPPPPMRKYGITRTAVSCSHWGMFEGLQQYWGRTQDEIDRLYPATPFGFAA